MKLSVVRTVPAWNDLAREWNDLLAGSVARVPFLRHEYLTNWWAYLGAPGEWPHGELHIVTARIDGELAAVAPLFASVNHDSEPVLALIGSDELSDYLDLIARPEHLAEFVAAMLEHLDSPEAPAWRSLDLYNLRDDSPTLPALEASAAARGWSCRRERIIDYSTASLAGGWEGYQSRLDKKQRHEFRRKMRRAEEAGNTRWSIVADRARLEEAADDLLRLMAFRADKATLFAPPVCQQLRGLLYAAFDAGWLQLARLVIAGQPAAAFLNFDYDGRIWVYNCGLDPAFRELSPGIVLLGHLIQWAADNGRSAVDFLRGEEAYKRHFGAVARPLWCITIERPALIHQAT
ncbi:MAG: GNAT family N-acetyltransferase [Gemmataceae bacterium]